MALGRYYLVNEATHKIMGGPYKMESTSVATWPVPDDLTLITEANMLSGGYTPTEEPVSVEMAIRAKALQALTVNVNYLAVTTPTAGQVSAQVKALTRQVQALIRLTLGQLDSDDT